MSDIEVIQRVLDYWNPLGIGGFREWSGGGHNTIDEYDRYAFPIADYLLKKDQLGLNEYLDDIQFSFMRNKKTTEAIAKTRYLSWCLTNVWKTQQRPDSNRRIVFDETRYLSDGAYRVVDEMDAIQGCLEMFDPLDQFPTWLHGEDTLCAYDLFAEEIWLNTRGRISEEDIHLTLQKITSGLDATAAAARVATTLHRMRRGGNPKRMEIHRRKMCAEKLSREEKIIRIVALTGIA